MNLPPCKKKKGGALDCKVRLYSRFQKAPPAGYLASSQFPILVLTSFPAHHGSPYLIKVLANMPVIVSYRVENVKRLYKPKSPANLSFLMGEKKEAGKVKRWWSKPPNNLFTLFRPFWAVSAAGSQRIVTTSSCPRDHTVVRMQPS